MKKLLLLGFLLAFAGASTAQTGPGGVGSTSTNPLWLDASRITGLASGASVNNWRDVSGNGNNAVQGGSVSRRPVYQTNVINGRPALYFDGDAWVQTGAIGALNTNNLTWYIIARSNSTSTTQFLINPYYSSNPNFWGTYYNIGSLSFYTFTRSNTGSFRGVNLGPQAGFNILSSVWNGSSIRGFVNGNLVGTTTGANGNPTGHQYTRIGAYASSNTYHLVGNISEVLVFSTALTTAQRNIVENYLSSKYGITVPTDLFAFDATHSYDVAGIGAEADGSSQTDSRGSGIVRMNSASSLNAGDYLLWGHDNDTTSMEDTDVPADDSRMSRIWRVDETGDVGTVTVSFSLEGLGISGAEALEIWLDDDGVFGDGSFTVHSAGRSYDANTSTLTFTGVNFSDGRFFTLGTSAIRSIATGNWNSTSTWNCGCIPNSGNTVIISSGHTVTVDAAATARNLTISPTATLAFNAATLSLTGNLSNSGTLNGGTAGTVAFTGTTAQTISGTGTYTFYHLTNNNSAGLSLSGATVSIGGNLAVNAGNFNTNGNTTTILSNATTTGSIGELGTGASITGNFIVQRYMGPQASGEYWHELAAPINSTVADWAAEFTYHSSGFYRWNEPTSDYVSITSTSTPLTPGQGFYVYLRQGSSTTWAGGTWDTRGVPNTGTISYPVTNQGPNADYQGWNLVGNPYAAWISWDDVFGNSPNLFNEIQIYDNGTYTSYFAGDNAQIPPGQGFWCHTSQATGASIVFTESAKEINNASTFYRKAPQEMQLILSSKMNSYRSVSKLKLRDESTEEFGYGDVVCLINHNKEAPEISTFASGSQSALNYNSFNSASDEVVIPVRAKAGVTGEYTISFAGLQHMKGEYECIILVDNQTNTAKAVDYSTTVTVYLEKDVAKNFTLYLRKSASACNETFAEAPASKTDAQQDIRIGSNFVDFNYNSDAPATITVRNMLGQEVIKSLKVAPSFNRITLNTLDISGIYFISVETDKHVITQRFYQGK